LATWQWPLRHAARVDVVLSDAVIYRRVAFMRVRGRRSRHSPATMNSSIIERTHSRPTRTDDEDGRPGGGNRPADTVSPGEECDLGVDDRCEVTRRRVWRTPATVGCCCCCCGGGGDRELVHLRICDKQECDADSVNSMSRR